MITINGASEKEYDLQFKPFFSTHNIKPTYGFSQKDNIVLWLHSTDFWFPHIVIPYRNGVVFVDYLLEEAKRGVDINKYANFGILANEILQDKYDLMARCDKAEAERKCVYKYFSHNIANTIKEILYRKIPIQISERVRILLEYSYDVRQINIKEGNIGYYIGKSNLLQYSNYYDNNNMFFCMRIQSFSEYFKNSETIKKQLDELKGKSLTNWYLESDVLVVTTILRPENMDKDISGFVDLTIDIINQNIEKEIEVTSPYLTFGKEILCMKAQQYFRCLSEVKEQYTILISAKDECSKLINKFIEISELPITSMKWRESYIAVIVDGKNFYEKTSNEKITQEVHIEAVNKICVTMVSEGYRFNKEESRILINNIDYSMNLRGLNFVVIDNKSGYVVDMFNIDTYQDNMFSINRMEKNIRNIRMQEKENINTIVTVRGE